MDWPTLEHAPHLSEIAEGRFALCAELRAGDRVALPPGEVSTLAEAPEALDGGWVLRFVDGVPAVTQAVVVPLPD